MRMMNRLLVCFAVIAMLAWSDMRPVSIDTHGTQFMGQGSDNHATVAIDVHIIRRDENRLLEIVWADDIGEVGRSSITLDGHNSQATFQRSLKNLIAGNYRVHAWLNATDRVDDATASFMITGVH